MPKKREMARKQRIKEKEMCFVRKEKSRSAGGLEVIVSTLEVHALLSVWSAWLKKGTQGAKKSAVKRRSMESATHAGKKRLYTMLSSGNL